jgi:DNA repair protein RecO (recombination protein O)
MAERVETDALVIQRFPYGESSQIAHLLTAALGRVAVLARGSHRPRNAYEGPLDLLERGRVTISLLAGRELGVLLARRVETAHPALRSHLGRHAAACSLLRRVLHFEPVGGGQGAFPLLDRALRALERIAPGRIDLLLLKFDAGLLELHGLRPDLEQCVRCGSPRRLCRFVAADGGVVCVGCVARRDEGAPIDGATAALLRGLARTPLREVASPQAAVLARARRLVDLHLGWHADAAPADGRHAPAVKRTRRRLSHG